MYLCIYVHIYMYMYVYIQMYVYTCMYINHTQALRCQVCAVLSVGIDEEVTMIEYTCVYYIYMERWGAGVEYHFQEFNDIYAPS